MAASDVPEVSLRQLEYVKGLEDALRASESRLRDLQAAWARGAPCPNIAVTDDGVPYCTLAARQHQ